MFVKALQIYNEFTNKDITRLYLGHKLIVGISHPDDVEVSTKHNTPKLYNMYIRIPTPNARLVVIKKGYKSAAADIF